MVPDLWCGLGGYHLGTGFASFAYNSYLLTESFTYQDKIFKIYLFHLFIFGCIGSSLLCAGFL